MTPIPATPWSWDDLARQADCRLKEAKETSGYIAGDKKHLEEP